MESEENKGTRVTFILPKYTPQEAAMRFLDNMIPPHRRKQSLVMIFYDIENLETLKAKLGNERIISIKQKMEKFMHGNIRRIAGDKVLMGEKSFLVALPQIEAADASLVAKRIGGSINEYLTAQRLMPEAKLTVSVVTYPQVKNNNRDLFAKVVNLIAESKMRM